MIPTKNIEQIWFLQILLHLVDLQLLTYCIPSSFTRGRTAALKDNISVMRGGWYCESDFSAGAASITPAPSGGLTYRNL